MRYSQANRLQSQLDTQKDPATDLQSHDHQHVEKPNPLRHVPIDPEGYQQYQEHRQTKHEPTPPPSPHPGWSAIDLLARQQITQYALHIAEHGLRNWMKDESWRLRWGMRIDLEQSPVSIDLVEDDVLPWSSDLPVDDPIGMKMNEDRPDAPP
jgi:hypothetical protein